MHHHVLHASPDRLLFTRWREARELWRRLARAAPGLHALVLMPDHVHLLHTSELRRPLAHAMSGYTRWRNLQLGRAGPGVAKLPAPEALVDVQKQRRSVRYLALNPCRAGLVRDPLAWPASTWRGAVGLGLGGEVRVLREPEREHAYVSADPSVRVAGSRLPAGPSGPIELGGIIEAVAALRWRSLEELREDPAGRRLAAQAARALGAGTPTQIADALGCTRQLVYDAGELRDGRVEIVRRVIGDPRFRPTFDGDLRKLPDWRYFAGME